jgi:hypothetical protein
VHVLGSLKIEAQATFINARCFGEDDLVSWLLESCKATSLLLGEPIQGRLWRLGFWVENDYWVAVGVMDDSIGIENQSGWLASTTMLDLTSGKGSLGRSTVHC